MKRVSIVGNSGSGKTTLGRRIAEQIGAPFVELDAIVHQPGWEPLPTEEFRAKVAEIAAQDLWVVDGNYSVARDILWDRADSVVWFDLPRRLVMVQVVRRTLRRTITREELWNGNREPLDNLWRLDPKRNIIRWAWTNHAKYRARYASAAADGRWAGVSFYRVGTRKDAEELLSSVAAGELAS
ncbi:MAG: shikimate kinase [Acidimicrobiales bacterium]